MAKRTTKAVLLTAVFCAKAAAPAQGQIEHHDVGVPGLRLRISAGGSRAFTMIYRVAGAQRRATWPMPAYGLADAREAARAVLRAVSEGREPTLARRSAPSPLTTSAAAHEIEAGEIEAGELATVEGGNVVAFRGPLTIGDVADRYIAGYLKVGVVRRAQDAEGVINNHIRKLIGTVAANALTRVEIRAMLATIAASKTPRCGGPAAANDVLKRLRAMLRWAAAQELPGVHDVTVGVTMPSPSKTRARILTDGELAAIWNATALVDEIKRAFARFVILSGQRRSEILGMHTREIDIERREWTIPAERYKTGVDHIVPLTEEMMAILAEIGRASGFVFSLNGGRKAMANPQDVRERLAELSGVEGWTWHDCRRTLRTRLSMLGILRDHAEAVIGHVVGSKVSRTYDRWQFVAEKRAALEAYGAHARACVAKAAAAAAAPAVALAA